MLGKKVALNQTEHQYTYVSYSFLSTTITSLCFQPRHLLSTTNHQYPHHVSYSPCFTTTIISFIWTCLPKQVIFYLRTGLQSIQIRYNVNGRKYQTRLNINRNSSLLGKLICWKEYKNRETKIVSATGDVTRSLKRVSVAA